MRAPIQTHIASEPREPTVERETSNKPAKERGKSVDKADPHPGLGRRVLFRERRPEEVE